MARLPRLIVPHQPHFIIQHGNDSQPLFRAPDDYRQFLQWLQQSARLCKVAVHAYALLPDRVLLLATPTDDTGLATCLQRCGRYYVPWYNAKYARSGALFGGRFKTAVVEAAAYLLPCSLYIEDAPRRAGLHADGSAWPWSSLGQHAGLGVDALVTDHRLVWDLGNTPFQREAAWKALSERGLAATMVRDIEACVLKGWPLGSAAFKADLQKNAQRQVLPARRGRPPKARVKRPSDSVPD